MANRGDNPAAFVVSQNLHRRNLSESQRAMIAAKIANMGRGRPGKSVNLPNKSQQVSNEEAAAHVNVSEKTVRLAKTVQQRCASELCGAVSSGEIRVSDAAKAADLPRAEQKRALGMVTSGEKKTINSAVG